ncbi:MAG: trigger factor [Candidatus Magasanikbacteria bacterium RIFOXYD2_FULL_41_14]|uniref:Trigger factor n=1 Tax=Candidatus Magasanikbacteria bacterium RIFOXYD2_FULL_41_14 TaxID=1798709 RepID=A0A1F6PDG4_9BACT|nr:MAG: trigger factor [Candidatus Magasanikbacteria bacterium RIFOXYD2_FULL_41_14]
MTHTLKQRPKSQVELIITVAVADYQKDMETAATRISQRAAIHGFRPGKAPYDIVKQQIGEIKILEEAVQVIVEKNFHTAVVAEKLITVGMPEISLEKMAPGNDFVFKATVALFPSLKLPDLATIKIAKKEVKVEDKQLNDVLDNLKKMRGKEVLKDGVATTADKAVVSMNMFIDKVPVEGGQAPNHQVYLSEPHYIPGFAEQIVGLKKDDKKNFTLKFPADHYQKHLAGKDIDFEVLVKDVYTLEYPTLDDEFAKGLGQTDLETLKKLLHGNLTAEAEKKETQRLEEEILHKIIEVATFGELPEVLMRTEKHKMFNELKADLERAGIDMEKYLKDLKKTEDEIFKDFEERAITRVKAALVSRQVALDNNIKVEPSEIEKEKEAIRVAYKGDDKVEDALKRPEVLDMLAVTVQNRKVVEYLKEKVVGKK